MLRYRIMAAIAGSCFLAGSASTQVNTNCAVYGNQINCNSSGGSGLTVPEGYGQIPLQSHGVDVGAAMEQAERIKQMRAQTALMEQQREEMAAQQEQIAAQQAQLDAQQARPQDVSRGGLGTIVSQIDRCKQAYPADAEETSFRNCFATSLGQ